MIEVMISLSVLVVVIGTMMGAVTTSNQMHASTRCRERALEAVRGIVTDVQNRDYVTTTTPAGTSTSITGIYQYYTANPTFDVVGLTPPTTPAGTKVGSVALKDASGNALAAAPASTDCIRVVITLKYMVPGASAPITYSSTYVHTQRQSN